MIKKIGDLRKTSTNSEISNARFEEQSRENLPPEFVAYINAAQKRFKTLRKAYILGVANAREGFRRLKNYGIKIPSNRPDVKEAVKYLRLIGGAMEGPFRKALDLFDREAGNNYYVDYGDGSYMPITGPGTGGTTRPGETPTTLPGTGSATDPITGLPITQPGTTVPEIDPVTGLPIEQQPSRPPSGEYDPSKPRPGTGTVDDGKGIEKIKLKDYIEAFEIGGGHGYRDNLPEDEVTYEDYLYANDMIRLTKPPQEALLYSPDINPVFTTTFTQWGENTYVFPDGNVFVFSDEEDKPIADCTPTQDYLLYVLLSLVISETTNLDMMQIFVFVFGWLEYLHNRAVDAIKSIKIGPFAVGELLCRALHYEKSFAFEKLAYFTAYRKQRLMCRRIVIPKAYIADPIDGPRLLYDWVRENNGDLYIASNVTKTFASEIQLYIRSCGGYRYLAYQNDYVANMLPMFMEELVFRGIINLSIEKVPVFGSVWVDKTQADLTPAIDEATNILKSIQGQGTEQMNELVDELLGKLNYSRSNPFLQASALDDVGVEFGADITKDTYIINVNATLSVPKGFIPLDSTELLGLQVKYPNIPNDLILALVSMDEIDELYHSGEKLRYRLCQAYNLPTELTLEQVSEAIRLYRLHKRNSYIFLGDVFPADVLEAVK